LEEVDQPACTGTTWWSTSSNAELRRFHQAIERRLMPGRTLKWKRAVKVGDASFFGLGAPTLGGHAAFTEEELKATALATLGWWHHTLECTIDKVDFNQMPTHLSVYASYLWELLTAPVLPYTYVPVAEQFIGRLTELAAPGKAIGLDGALVRAEQFRATAARFDEAADRWRERYAKDGTKDDGPAEALNGCIKRLGRLLVPLESTAIGTYGHDPYGLTAQTTMIPCLAEAPRLETLPETEERWMLETKLVRQRNRVADALGDAGRLIDETLARLA